MSQDDDKDISGAEDQDEGQGEDLENKDTPAGAEEDSEQEGSEGGEGEGSDDSDADKRFKDQQGRAKKAEGERDTYKQRLVDAGLDPDTGKPKEKDRAPKKDDQALSDLQKQVSAANERAERAELRSLGVTHPDDVQYVREAAKRLGVDVVEAVSDEIVAAKLQRMQEARKTKDATPPPGRGGGPTRSGKLPDFSKMSDEEFDKYEKANRR